MNRFIKSAILAMALTFASAEAAADDETAIRSVVASYQLALNKSDLGAVVELFADDAVVMLQESPTAVGRKNIRDSYQTLFGSLTFDLDFNIVEAVQLSPDWALVRTASSGNVKIVSSGSMVANAGQELFILHKDKAWRIARYAGSSTK